MADATSVGWTFHGLAEDDFFDDSNDYLRIDPSAYGFAAGQQVQGQLLLSDAALVAYLTGLDGAGQGSVTLDATAGVTFSLPLPRVGGLDEADFIPLDAPTLTLTSQGAGMPLADAQAFLFSQNDPDGPNFWMSQADAGGFFFRDDDDTQLHIYGAWVPFGAVVEEVVGGDAGETLQGGEGLALLFGRDGDDSLLLQAAGYAWGGFGNDQLIGSGGRDWLYGGYDNDVISGGGGDDVLYGEGGSDRISGGSGNDVIYGDSRWQPGGDDRLSGNAGDDRLFGGWGNDILRGGEGADYLDGGEGEDTADYSDASSGVGVSLIALGAQVGSSEAAGDVLLSIENLSGSRFSDGLVGDQGNNRLYGREGDDRLFGNGGSDHLYGDDGNDRLNGGMSYNHPDGNDYLSGGAGNDTFEFTLNYWQDWGGYLYAHIGLDTVLDFNPQEDLLSFIGTPRTFNAMAVSEHTTTTGETGTLLTVHEHSKIFLLGVVADQLNDSNMQLVDA